MVRPLAGDVMGPGRGREPGLTFTVVVPGGMGEGGPVLGFGVVVRGEVGEEGEMVLSVVGVVREVRVGGGVLRVPPEILSLVVEPPVMTEAAVTLPPVMVREGATVGVLKA